MTGRQRHSAGPDGVLGGVFALRPRLHPLRAAENQEIRQLCGFCRRLRQPAHFVSEFLLYVAAGGRERRGLLGGARGRLGRFRGRGRDLRDFDLDGRGARRPARQLFAKHFYRLEPRVRYLHRTLSSLRSDLSAFVATIRVGTYLAHSC